MEADLNARVLDGGYEHNMILHCLSAVDDFAPISVTDTWVVGGLFTTMPDVPFPAAVFDGAHIPADETRDDYATTLRDGPYDEVTRAWRRSHIASRSRECDLSEEADAGNARIPTRVSLAVRAPRFVILPLG